MALPHTKRFPAALAALVLLAAATAGSVHAEGAPYPAKPVRVVVHSGAGGPPDLLIRVVVPEMARRLGQPLFVDNKPGAAGAIGIGEIARAAPDGYTIGFANATTLAINQSLYSKLPYDAERQLAPIGLIGFVSNALVVRSRSSFRSIDDLLNYAKRNPGKLSMGSSGNGGTGHLSGELFKAKAGISMLHVPYRGSAAAVQDLAGGMVDLMFENISMVLPQIQSGQLRALAVTSKERSPLLPAVPTVMEAGLPGYEMVAWGGLVAPAGTSPDIIATLNRALNQSLDDPVVKKRLSELGTETSTGEPERLFTLARKERPIWAEIVKFSNAKMD